MLSMKRLQLRNEKDGKKQVEMKMKNIVLVQMKDYWYEVGEMVMIVTNSQENVRSQRWYLIAEGDQRAAMVRRKVEKRSEE